MENENKTAKIYKATDPKELIVYYAESSCSRIRFYLNETWYLEATETPKGPVVEEGHKRENYFGRKAFKWIEESRDMVLLTITIFVSLLIAILIKEFVTTNSIAILICLNIACLVVGAASFAISEFFDTPYEMKSKHASEHMVINFMEKNKRLPKNLEELRKSSRFTIKCGSRIKIEGLSVNTTISMLSILIAKVLSLPIKNATLSGGIFLLIYVICVIVLFFLNKKYKIFWFIAKPIIMLLANVVQLGNTLPVKDVKDKDLELAYLVASKWLQVVYPQFYNKEDIFLKNKVNITKH